MRRTNLRTAAARHFLGLTNTDYLVEVAHESLDRSIYARGRGENATVRNPILSEIGPLFASAIRELDLEVSTREEALDLLAQAYIVSLVEGVRTPREAISEIFHDYLALSLGPTQKHRQPEIMGSLAEFVQLYYQYDLRFDPYEADIDLSVFFEIDAECLRLAKAWCQSRWVPGFDISWRSSTVVSIAITMDETQCFEMLPILGDALQEAGCSNEDILNHCHTNEAHRRNCWVVDLLMGKLSP